MELVLIVVLALIVFGPAKLPEIMAQVGKAIGDFRRATSDLSDEFNRTIQAELQEGRSVLNETKAAVTDVHTTVNSAVTATPPAPTLVAAPGEVVVATNGTGPESHGENGVNNDLAPASKPPLADTSQWSWETAAPPPPPSAPSPPTDPTGTDPLKPDAAASEPQKAVEPPSADAPAAKPRERDELLPPY
ncbi:MAG TPA: twin-arginine translocase TatA/TatE family subunit [Chloroflexota bacterium]|nr:twin-arginine translocase TatA/TatE family subunit [Chloroflexota bacterium]